MKLVAIEARIADLNRMRRTLKNLIAQCGAGGGKVRCPIIETLARDSNGRISFSTDKV